VLFCIKKALRNATEIPPEDNGKFKFLISRILEELLTTIILENIE
jgi:hypothetical protein